MNALERKGRHGRNMKQLDAWLKSVKWMASFFFKERRVNEHYLPLYDDPYGGEPLANYVESSHARMHMWTWRGQKLETNYYYYYYFPFLCENK